MEPGNQAFLGVLFDQQEEMFPDPDNGMFPIPDHLYGSPEKSLEDWEGGGSTALNDCEESDDFLKMIINPNAVYSSGTTIASPESDSGISEDPRSDSPQQSDVRQSQHTPPALYEVIYNIGDLGGLKSEATESSFVSIQLEDWNSSVLIPESCIVNELTALPVSAALKASSEHVVAATAELQAVAALYPELLLTEEEKRLLSQEGVSLPNNLPLTKAEERILKKVRRKIRNKRSAQDSRRRKKEYIDGLESRVAACSAQNQELQKKVLELEKHNVSLITQLRRLQTLIKQTSTKAAQTSTCILIFVFSLALLVFPSYSPFRWRSAVNEDGYKPIRAISRNILHEGDFTEGGDTVAVESASPSERDTAQSWQALAAHMPAVREKDAHNQARHLLEYLPEEKRPNASAAEAPGEMNEAVPHPKESQTAEEGLQLTSHNLSPDSGKPVHADEM
ncbi:cyclic AMP-responsive element-binding protein 3-like protein 4 [Rhinatrema bivittatum]|uniref:cyclic AMP-responsive element-binding protein 3-like protein 4 n=1 Tax=Rhinatrema bivittatum TaxID=194408 RepID=UPI001129643C|nr:cyclic AMP-responsive element-binding protein 3-like protein 4 [Rhinatrema bivittatum]XP_029437083.1 cyclic AMP-responsive element-binding protein 3-like protein 4 [Rhinatrema bivittatum]